MMEDAELFLLFENFEFENNTKFKKGWSTVASVVDLKRVDAEYLKAKIFFYSKFVQPINLENYLAWKEQQNNRLPTVSGDGGLKCQRNQTPEDGEIGATSCSDDTLSNNSTSDSQQASLQQPVLVNDTVSSDDGKTDYSEHSVLAKLDCGTSQTDFDDDIHKISIVTKDISIIDSDKDESSISKLSSGCSEDEVTSLSLLEVASHIQNGTPIPGIISIDVQPTNKEPTPSQCKRKLKPWEAATNQKEES